MSSINLSTSPLFQEQLNAALQLCTDHYDSLQKNSASIGFHRLSWGTRASSLALVDQGTPLSKEALENEYTEAAAQFQKLRETQLLAQEIIQQLGTTLATCFRPGLEPNTLITLKGYGVDIDALRQRTSFANTTFFQVMTEKRKFEVIAQNIDTNLPKAEKALEALLEKIQTLMNKENPAGSVGAALEWFSSTFYALTGQHAHVTAALTKLSSTDRKDSKENTLTPSSSTAVAAPISPVSASASASAIAVAVPELEPVAASTPKSNAASDTGPTSSSTATPTQGETAPSASTQSEAIATHAKKKGGRASPKTFSYDVRDKKGP